MGRSRAVTRFAGGDGHEIGVARTVCVALRAPASVVSDLLQCDVRTEPIGPTGRQCATTLLLISAADLGQRLLLVRR